MAWKHSVAAVVVVYNHRCEDSSTCQALEKISGETLTVLIHDNSTSDFGIREYCRKKGWIYLGGEGNVGISRAYNNCIDYLKEYNRTDYLCLFDDDTELDERYFSRMLKAADQSGSRILLPLIYAGGRLLSPCMLTENHRVKGFSDAENAINYRGNQISAINSGMALSLSLFDDYRYDEHIFLDGVDHSFMLDMRKREEPATVFSYRCDHDFSGAAAPCKESALNRFRIYAKDYRYILRDRKAAYYALVGKRAMNLTLRYRCKEFLAVFLKP